MNIILWNEIQTPKDEFASCCIPTKVLFLENDKLLDVETNDMKVSSGKMLDIINLFPAHFLFEHNVKKQENILLSYYSLSVINCIQPFKRQIIKLSKKLCCFYVN